MCQVMSLCGVSAKTGQNEWMNAACTIIWSGPLEVSLDGLAVRLCCAAAQRCGPDGQMWTDRASDPWMIVHLSAPAAESLGRSTLWTSKALWYHMLLLCRSLFHLFFSSLFKEFLSYVFIACATIPSIVLFVNAYLLICFISCFFLYSPSPFLQIHFFLYLLLFIPVNLIFSIPSLTLSPPSLYPFPHIPSSFNSPLVRAQCCFLQHFLLHSGPPQMSPK